MPVTQFVVGASRTVNLGNFESLRVEAQVTWELDQNLGKAESQAAAQEELRQLLEQTYRAMTAKTHTKALKSA
jgi:hypothetical protein